MKYMSCLNINISYCFLFCEFLAPISESETMHFSEGRMLLDLIRIFPLVNYEAKVKARG